jgi:hypothetical protein
MRKQWFKSRPGMVTMICNYTKRVKAEFNFEIQQAHFGNGCDLSIKGSVVEFFQNEEQEKLEHGLATLEDINPIMESHSHVSNDK